jgi:hypothetical protein
MNTNLIGLKRAGKNNKPPRDLPASQLLHLNLAEIVEIT